MAFAEFIQTAEGLISLIGTFLGLCGTAAGIVVAIKGWIKAFKEKDAKQKWALIMEIADAAMKEAEKSGKSGVDKKQMVIDSVKAGCKAAGIDVSPFIDQLGNYIDSCIDWFNGMKK